MLRATAAAEDEHAWFRSLRRVARQMLETAARRGPLTRILDCGAGTGRNLDWLKEFGTPIGLELTPFGRQTGRRLGRRMVGGSATALPFPDAVFDLVTSFDVLYCLDDGAERQALHEMVRVLSPGGVALINVAAFESLRGSHSTLTHEVRRYTPAMLSARLDRAGFTVERVTCTNALLFVPTLLVRGIERLTGRSEQPSEADLAVPSRVVNAVLDRGLSVEAALLRRVNLPLGTSVMALARKAR